MILNRWSVSMGIGPKRDWYGKGTKAHGSFLVAVGESFTLHRRMIGSLVFMPHNSPLPGNHP